MKIPDKLSSPPFMASKSVAKRLGALRGAGLLLAFLLVCQPGAHAEEGKWLDVDFPRDSPVLPVSFSLRPTTARVVGSSMALELHASLLLRNTGSKSLSGLTLRVDAQDLTPAGRGSVTVPSVEAKPGETFPVRIDLELRRPFSLGQGEGAMVRVSLDCALFGDLTSYGPDELGSRRSLLVYEMQARRDRQYLAKLLHSGQIAAIREELNFGLEDLYPARLALELLRSPGAALQQQPVAVRTMPFPNSPIQALNGLAQVAGNEVRDPRIEIKNRSAKVVRSLEVGWVVRDDRGRAFIAGLLPSTVELDPVQTATTTTTGVLRFSRSAGPNVSIASLLAFVSDVEFADGKLWIPSRSDIDQATSDPILRQAMANSPEQQRLAQVYRRRGISGLTEELRKAN